MNRIRVAITGNPINIWFLRSSLDDINISFSVIDRSFKKLPQTIKNVTRANVIHIISLKLSGIEGLFWVLIFLILRFFRKRVILHWIGSDVSVLESSFAVLSSKLINQHLSYAPWLSDELRAKGIEPVWLPILPPLDCSQHRIPENFTILVGLGGDPGRGEFYGSKEIEIIARSLPDVKILIVGQVAKTNKLNFPNVQYFGHVKYEVMDELYKKSTVLLRITKHDGLSLMVLEALARGRYVVWSKKFPHCCFAQTAFEALRHIEKLRDVSVVNTGGLKFINGKFNNKVWLSKLIEIYGRVLK